MSFLFHATDDEGTITTPIVADDDQVMLALDSSSSSAEAGFISLDLYTEHQKMILAIVPVVTGTLSLMGSCTILGVILHHYRKTLVHVYHRLILVMATLDAIISVMFALSSVLVPKDDPYSWNPQGNISTCDVQGFFLVLSPLVSLYNSFLCVYYLLTIRYGMREETIAKWVEPFVHTVPPTAVISLASISLAREYFNPLEVVSGWCFLVDNPPQCTLDPNIECIRGGGPSPGRTLIINLLGYGFFGVSFTVIFVSMLLIYMHVRRTEREFSSDQNNSVMSDNSTVTKMKRTRETAQQAALYVVAVTLTFASWGPVMLTSRPPTPEHRTYHFVTALLVKICYPLQGMWNFFIFIRPRYVALSAKMQGKPLMTVLRSVFIGESNAASAARRRTLSIISRSSRASFKRLNSDRQQRHHHHHQRTGDESTNPVIGATDDASQQEQEQQQQQWLREAYNRIAEAEGFGNDSSDSFGFLQPELYLNATTTTTTTTTRGNNNNTRSSSRQEMSAYLEDNDEDEKDEEILDTSYSSRSGMAYSPSPSMNKDSSAGQHQSLTAFDAATMTTANLTSPSLDQQERIHHRNHASTGLSPSYARPDRGLTTATGQMRSPQSTSSYWTASGSEDSSLNRPTIPYGLES